MIDFIARGGVLVGPLLLCSVVALTIFLERLFYFARVRIRGFGLVANVTDHVAKGEDQQALALTRESKSPMGRILEHALEVKGQDRETLETVIVHSTDEEVRDRYRIWELTRDNRSIQHVIDAVRQYEETYGAGDGAEVLLRYTRNGGDERVWEWPGA